MWGENRNKNFYLNQLNIDFIQAEPILVFILRFWCGKNIHKRLFFHQKLSWKTPTYGRYQLSGCVRIVPPILWNLEPIIQFGCPSRFRILRTILIILFYKERPTNLILWPLSTQTHTDTHKDKHGYSMTNPAQRAKSVKVYIFEPKTL